MLFIQHSFVTVKVFETNYKSVYLHIDCDSTKKKTSEERMPLQSDAKPFQATPKKLHLELPKYEIRHEETFTIVKSTKIFEEFSERKELLTSPLEYSRNGSDQGLVLIFNQESFEDLSYRLGSRRDVNEIITCMSRLGFNINENHIYTDYRREEIMRVIKEVVERDLSETNCLIVFFLTHGDAFDRLHAYDLSLQTSDLWKYFAECEQLKNKPKMFIFQACKGDSHSTIPSNHKTKIDIVPDNTFTSDYIGPDMLIVYSTSEGNVSFRDSRLGTWFIQELCKAFSAYGRRDDVLSLIMRTTKCICRNYYHNDGDKVLKQMPVFISTLRKKFYLTRSKDRNILLKIMEDQNRMRADIQELEAKVQELLHDKEKKK